jgi:exonuclease III
MNNTKNPNHVNSSVNRDNKENNLNRNNLRLVHWNCNSLNNKIDEFKDFCFTNKPHVISLNETKLSEDRADYILQIDNYNVIHKTRNSGKNGAGGVALLIREDINFSECKIFDNLEIEICAVNIMINKNEVCVLSYYNPPQKELSEKVFEILKETKTKFILMGDLNAKTTLWEAEINNSNGDILDEIILNNDCLIMNNKESTHYCFNGKTESILDYCIVSSNIHKLFDSIEVLKNNDMTSDHVPIKINFNQGKINPDNGSNISNKRKAYNYNKADWGKFADMLPKTLPSDIGEN